MTSVNGTAAEARADRDAWFEGLPDKWQVPVSRGLSDDQVLDALRHGPNAAQFSLYYDHSTDEPPSEAADVAFVKLLLPYTGADTEAAYKQIDRIFKGSTMLWQDWGVGQVGSRPYYRRVIALASVELWKEWAADPDAAAAAAEAPGKPSYPDPEDMGTAVASDLAAIEYVDNLVKPARIGVTGAVEGVGKTYTVSCELGIRFAWAGGKLAETWEMRERGNVLLLSEMHRDDDIAYEDRVLAALHGTRAALKGRYYRLSLASAANGKPVLMDVGWVNWLVEYVKRRDIKLVILDTVASAIAGDPWGENLIEVYRTLRAITEACPSLAIMLVTHMRKPAGPSEQAITDVMGQWTRYADVVLLMTPHTAEGGKGQVRLRTLKRLREPVDIIATQDEGLLVDPIPVDHEHKPKVEMGDVIYVIKRQPDMTYAELADALKVSKKTAERYVDQGVKMGLLKRHREQSNGPWQVRADEVVND